MMAYANMIRRDVTRFQDCLERLDECPLGAGALATSTYPVDRFATAETLAHLVCLETRGRLKNRMDENGMSLYSCV